MEMSEVLNNIPQVGKVEWIGIRTKRREALTEVQSVNVSLEGGLEGDHYKGRSAKRQVTLIQSEHLKAVAGMLQRDSVHPQEVRRNIVVSGVNLLAFKNKQLSIGENVVLEITGYCHPCTRMEENLGPGGYNAMRGHGGMTAKVIKEGEIAVGDEVKIFKDLMSE